MVTWNVEQAELAVVGQFEFLFLYGPRFAGWLSFASISATISSSDQSRREASKAIEAVDAKLKQCDALLAAGRKAEQQRAAKKTAECDKMIREGSVKAYRKELGKDAVGRTDAEVERICKQREADILKQAAAFSSSGNAMSGQSQKLDPNTRSQRDAQAKSMTGKSVTELERMDSKELEAFTRDMEKKYGK